METRTDDRPILDATPPRRVLILSAEMGEGHNAAAQALTETMADMWPETEVERVDTFRTAGERVAHGARWAYGFQLSRLPWSYQIFYDALSRHDGMVRGLKAIIGAFFGTRLERVIADRRPDLIISTYPFASAGLDWLAARGRLSVPTATYIPAFHVHPLWAYGRVGLHFVMYDTAPEHARTPGFAPTMRLGAPPVRRGFGDISRADARAALGLAPDAFVVLVTGGAWGLGNLDRAVAGLLAIDSPIQVITVCGKNAQLAADLRALRSDRLTVLGYVDNMQELMAAASVVVTNGAGVTVLEALQTPRPVIAFSPLVGHGRAATDEMLRRDLAVRADDSAALTDAVGRLAADQTSLQRMERAVSEWRGSRELRHSVEELGALFRGDPQPASASSLSPR